MSKLFTLAFTLQCLSMSLLLAWNGNAQVKSIEDVPVHLSLSEVKVEKAFKELERITEFNFVFASREIRDRPLVSVESNGDSLYDLLVSIATQSNLSFKQVDGNIHVKKTDRENLILISETEVITVSGTVIDENGEPMPGATITVEGTVAGTVSDVDGNFSIDVDEGAVLVVSFIGYQTKRVSVANQSQIEISMVLDDSALEEVVVVGFGTQKKVNLTGSVASVDGDQILQRPVPNAASMLQGRMAGVRVVQNSGQPGGEGIGIQIRGQGTFSGAGSNPLVLIDGVEGDLNAMDPNDIESVSVLKDAASASIYGSRAANGVILVTTKKGEKGSLQVNYHGNFASHSPTRLFDLISDSAEYMELWNEAKANSNISAGLYTQDQINMYRDATDRNLYPNTDWMGLMFNAAPTQTHNLSFNGGEKLTTYNISLGYLNQEGVMNGFDFERYNFRINLSSGINENIKFGTNLFMKQGDRSNPRQGAQDTFLSTLSQAPTYGPRLPDGSGRYAFKAFDFESNNKNPIAIVENEVFNKVRDYNINAQAWAEFNLTDAITWYTKGAIVGDFVRSRDWRPEVPLYNFTSGEFMTDLDVGGRGLNISSSQNMYTNLFSYLNYSELLNEKHQINAQIGYSQEHNSYEVLTGYREQFPSNLLRELNAGSPAVQNASGTSNSWAIQSLFGRFGYNYEEKYLLEFNMRYDGTSRLSPENRWGVFPSISAGWRVSDEAFLEEASGSWLDDLKIRASYGELGNQNIGLYPYQDILQFTGAYPFDNSALFPGMAQNRLTNRNIIWETTEITDIGIDMMVLSGLTLTVDWYRKTTSDILRSSQVTGVVGLDPPTINNGVLRNTGLEVMLNYRNFIRSGKFSGLNYEAQFYIDHFKNELVSFGAEEISGTFIRREGLPWNSFFMLEYGGIFQTDEEISNNPSQFNDNTVPGDIRFVDQNGDGEINDDDRVVTGNPFPLFEYSFNLNADWKGFDMSIFFQGVQRRDIFVNNWGMLPFIQGSPPTVEWRERWTPENPSQTMPRMYWGWNDAGKISRNSSYFLHDASFLRLKNIVFGYTLPDPIIEKIGLKRARIYFSGDNLLTFTSFPGLDPERGGSGNFVNYPQNKIYALGVQIQL